MSDKNDTIYPPRLVGSNKNLQQIVIGASQVVAVDEVLRNRCVRIKVTSACAFYFRSDNAGTVDQTLATQVGPTSATLGYQMAAGTWEDFNLGGADNYIVVQGSAGLMQLLGSGPNQARKRTP